MKALRNVEAKRAGEADVLSFYSRLYEILYVVSTSARSKPEIRAYEAAQRRRDRALEQFEDGAKELLSLYDAPEHSPAWMAVYVSPTDQRWDRSTRRQHAVNIRATLAALRSDSAFKSRPQPRPSKRPNTRHPVPALRAIGLSRDAALVLLRSLGTIRQTPAVE